jgi:hypothetical protein
VITFRALDLHYDYDYVKTLIEAVICDDTKGIVAERDGRRVGAVLFDSWTLNSVQVHIGIEDPLVFKHGLHREVCVYAFLTCGTKMMLGLVPSNNAKAIKLNTHFGFEEVARIKDALEDGVDYIIMQLNKSECKYLTVEERQEREVA